MAQLRVQLAAFCPNKPSHFGVRMSWTSEYFLGSALHCSQPFICEHSLYSRCHPSLVLFPATSPEPPSTSPTVDTTGDPLAPNLFCCSSPQSKPSANGTAFRGAFSSTVTLSAFKVTSPQACSQDFLSTRFLYLGEQLDNSSCFPPQAVSEMR